MKIHALTFKDTVRQWWLNRTEFNRLTLLVGASGVGKTQILASIMRLQKFTQGHSGVGIEWKIEFSIETDNYVWEGGFENPLSDEAALFLNSFWGEASANIKYEYLSRNDITIIERDNKNIVLAGVPTVRLSPSQSALYLLKEEDAVKSVYENFQQITLTDYQRENSPFLAREGKLQIDQFSMLEQIQTSRFSTKTKLYLTSKNLPPVFEHIKNRFRDVFLFVEDIKIEPIFSLSREEPFIQVKEHGVKPWIPEWYLSSGMYRTLMQISDLYLSPKGTVALIDEFENSLGVNCINEVTGDLLTSQRDLQFIITSHHPYIINRISYENWKLVTRKAGVVTTHNASEFNLGQSKHEAFTQLINLDAFEEGITL